MLGYLQMAPRGIVYFAGIVPRPAVVPKRAGRSGGLPDQHRRQRPDHAPEPGGSATLRGAGKDRVCDAAKGTPVLPKDGSWSVVAHKKSTGEVLPISNSVVPLIQRGLHPIANNNNALELANPGDLFNLNMEDRATQYAFLQNTDTQKVLFRNPSFLRRRAKTAKFQTRPGRRLPPARQQGHFPENRRICRDSISTILT